MWRNVLKGKKDIKHHKKFSTKNSNAPKVDDSLLRERKPKNNIFCRNYMFFSLFNTFCYKPACT